MSERISAINARLSRPSHATSGQHSGQSDESPRFLATASDSEAEAPGADPGTEAEAEAGAEAGADLLGSQPPQRQ